MSSVRQIKKCLQRFLIKVKRDFRGAEVMPQDNRKKPTPNQDQLFFAEVGGLCPLCGKSLMILGKNKYVKQYQIAHIYPCNPTTKDLSVLAGIEPPTDTEEYSNKIALCISCHQTYDDDKTLDRYTALRRKKDRLMARDSIRNVIGDYPLEDDISDILTKLLLLDDSGIEPIELSVTALKVKAKVEDEYALLRRNIEENVTKYYAVVQKMLKELGTDRFDNIAIQIKSFYKKCDSLSNDKEVIFDQIVEWVKLKSGNDNRIASEIVVSFFVQNCEVFDAITE